MKKKSKKKILYIALVPILVIVLLLASYTVYSLVHTSKAVHTLAEYQERYTDLIITQDTEGDVSLLPADESEAKNIGIIFYQGASVEPLAYVPLLSKLAEDGYAVYAPQFPCGMAVFDIDVADEVVNEHPEIKAWYIAGHSMGGRSASKYALSSSENLLGIISISSPVDKDVANLDLPLLMLYGNLDGIYHGTESGDALPEDTTICSINGGNHAQFGDYGNQLMDKDATISPKKQRKKGTACILKWLHKHDNDETVYADTVVYGSIYTAETDNPTAEAIAIKDGKYVYVGDEAGVEAYINDGTQIIDHRDKGMVMPGCTDGHSHYTMSFGMEGMKGSIMFDTDDDKAAVLEKLEKAALEAKDAGKKTLFGFGWSYLNLTLDPLTLKEMDEATHGVSALIFDQGGHHAFCNSECLKRSGIIDGEGNVLKTEIDGGYLKLDDKGYPTGYADERVTGYLMRNGGIDYDEIADDTMAETSIQKTQDLLLSTGYTMALDGWSNMFHPDKLYKAANRMDKNNKLKIVFPMTYEVEPWQTDKEIDAEIDKLVSYNETYGTRHVLPEYLKIFMDGVVETITGAMLKPYKDGTDYKSFWPVNRLANITSKCNAKGLTVHTHVMGDAAIKETTDAYIKGGDGTHRNCMVHLRNVREEDFKRFAKNNIACSAGMTWHVSNGDLDKYLAEYIDDEYLNHAYPMKSFFDAGVKVSSHSDFPANIPCPQDPFGIMQVALTGTIEDPSTDEMLPVYDKDELVTIDQVFQALTINGAWQLGLEKERGSIKVGKWADFVLADNDVFTCEKTDIGDTKVVSTWFEGEKVYEETFIQRILAKLKAIFGLA